MSFLTSFWFFPQKEQERFPCSSRLRSVGTGQKRSTDPPGKSAPLSAVRPPATLAFRWPFLGPFCGLFGDDAGFLDEHLVDDAVLLRLAGAHEIAPLGG